MRSIAGLKRTPEKKHFTPVRNRSAATVFVVARLSLDNRAFERGIELASAEKHSRDPRPSFAAGLALCERKAVLAADRSNMPSAPDKSRLLTWDRGFPFLNN